MRWIGGDAWEHGFVIGTLNEGSLHAQLKQWYAVEGDQLERPVDGYVIDLVRGDLLVEIQTGGFSPLRKKLTNLLESHPVRLVAPIALHRRIVKLSDDGEILSSRRSPKHGRFEDVFARLVSIPTLINNELFELEVVLTIEDEYRTHQPGKAWRRGGWAVAGRSLERVEETKLFASARDLAAMLPTDLPEPFTTTDLTASLGCSYRQGNINFIINHEPNSFAQSFADVHGPSCCAFAIRVADAAMAYDYAVKKGAEPFQGKIGPMELNIPAIMGIGRSLLYLVDRYDSGSIYEIDFVPYEGIDLNPKGVGLMEIDHLTHNVHNGRMDEWAGFYEDLFNFKEIRYFDIKGKATGLKSRAMTSPCGKIRIPINEPSDQKSQIQEYLDVYNGEGIQHIALTTNDIYQSIEMLRANNVELMDVPDTYYEKVNERLPGHGEDLERLQKNKILIDGDLEHGHGLLLQIFTQTVIGPIFFEIIQRKGNEGFGEGNFRALFESIERDQMKRGVI